MSYLININSGVQAASGNQSLSSLLKYSLSALEVDHVSTMTLKLEPDTPLELSLVGVLSLHLLALQSNNPVDYAIGISTTTVGTAIFTTYPSQMTLRVFPNGQPATKVYLRSSVASVVELAYAGREVFSNT